MLTRRAWVVGAGTMGAGIAAILLAGGVDVWLTDENPAALERGRAGIDRHLTKQAPPAPGQLNCSVDLPDAVDVDLAIEAVPEDAKLKTRVLAAIEQRVPAGAVIASNSSALSMEGLSDALVDPGRFVGMHFFNPVVRSRLIEIVVPSRARADAVAQVRRCAEELGKEVIQAKDSPGFATSRLGVLLGLEATRMLEEGVASAEDIDRGMVLGYGLTVGPLRISDIVGLDVRLAISEYLQDTLGDRFAPPALLRDKVTAGHLGRKSGQGFFTWDPAS